jgi:hypothetical protein
VSNSKLDFNLAREEDQKMELEQAIDELYQTRASISEVKSSYRSGIYAIYLRHGSRLEGFPPGKDGLIYIGGTSNLAKREYDNHFNSKKTRISTLRRSLGAILKQELKLVAIPRSPGPSETNVRNYKFLPDGEERLTKWMKTNLEVGNCVVLEDYETIEDLVINTLEPVLNLTGWNNPYREDIKALRKICADEARKSRATGS